MTPGREAALRDLLKAMKAALDGEEPLVPEVKGTLTRLINGTLDHVEIHEAARLLRHETSTWGQARQAVTR